MNYPPPEQYSRGLPQLGSSSECEGATSARQVGRPDGLPFGPRPWVLSHVAASLRLATRTSSLGLRFCPNLQPQPQIPPEPPASVEDSCLRNRPFGTAPSFGDRHQRLTGSRKEVVLLAFCSESRIRRILGIRRVWRACCGDTRML